MFNVRTLINTSFASFTLLAGLTVSEMPTAAAPIREISASRPQLMRVFFPRNPGQQKDLSHVEPVWRRTHNSAVAQFTIEQLIAGPSPQERRLGFMSAIRLGGASDCGRDFTLTVSSNVARVRFCRQVISGGIGDDARANSSINATLRQFPNIRSVVILDKRGNCLGDMSGDNRCLR